jgi:hypothetical protein
MVGAIVGAMVGVCFSIKQRLVESDQMYRLNEADFYTSSGRNLSCIDHIAGFYAKSVYSG